MAVLCGPSCLHGWLCAPVAKLARAPGGKRRTKVRLTDENLRGRVIIAADGQVIGEITALFLECDSWRVESLQARLGDGIADQIGANHSIFRSGTLEIPVRVVQSVGDTVVLSVPVDGLRELLPTDARTTASPVATLPAASHAKRDRNQEK